METPPAAPCVVLFLLRSCDRILQKAFSHLEPLLILIDAKLGKIEEGVGLSPRLLSSFFLVSFFLNSKGRRKRTEGDRELRLSMFCNTK